jgi:hypothetical protein
MEKVMKQGLLVTLCVCLGLPVVAQEKEDHRLQESYDVLREVLTKHT